MIATSVVRKTKSNTHVSPAPQASLLDAIDDPLAHANIALNVRAVKESIRRSAWEVVQIGNALIGIKRELEKLGHRRERPSFDALCETEFGMAPRVAKRFIDAAIYVETQLANRPDAIDNLSATVIYRLSEGAVPAQVVEQVIESASKGSKITPADLRAAIKRVEEDVQNKDAELQGAIIEATNAKQEAESAQMRADQAELTAARLREQTDSLARGLQRARDETAQLTNEQAEAEREISELKARLENPAVVEVEVPKIPDGYKNLEQAIKDKEKNLRGVENKIAEAEAKIVDAQKKLSGLQGQAAAQYANAEVLIGFRADIQSLCAKYPNALIAAATSSDPRVAVECSEIAAYLRKLADQIDVKVVGKPARE